MADTDINEHELMKQYACTLEEVRPMNGKTKTDDSHGTLGRMIISISVATHCE